MQQPFEKLFSTVNIGGLEIANRIYMLPMTTGYCEADETVGSRMVNFFSARAKGGAGLIVAPFSPVDASSPVEPGLYDDRFVPGVRHLAESVHAFGSKIFVQLIVSYHVTFKGAAEVVGPSDFWNAIMRCNPRPLTVEEIRYIVGQYGQAARRARESGMDGVEVLVGGGYLLNRFLSPLGNTRDDDYGGTPEKRLRIILEIIDSIQKNAGRDFPIGCRLNCEEQMKGGYTVDDCEFIVKELEKAGLSSITVYTGWHESPVPTVQPMLPKAAFIHLTEKIKGWVNIPVIASNKINDPFIAERVLAEGKADMVGMARALLADPELPKKAREGRTGEIVPCLGCSECIAEAISSYRDWGKPVSVSCSVNPQAGFESESVIIPAEKQKIVWVIGSGPGGMEAAIQASLRGHKVSVFEKAGETGGKLLQACIPPHKEAVRDLIGSFRARAKKAGVEIRLNTAIGPEDVEAGKPDVLVIAIGAAALVPGIPGIENVVLAEDVLSGRERVAGRVMIIGGGMVGCETAEYLLSTEAIKDVTVVEMLDRMADNVSPTYRPFFLSRLKKSGIKMKTNARVIEITPQGLKLDQNGEVMQIDGDAVVLAAGFKEDARLKEIFKGRAAEVYAVGDCARAGMIREAVKEGFLAGRKI